MVKKIIGSILIANFFPILCGLVTMGDTNFWDGFKTTWTIQGIMVGFGVFVSIIIWCFDDENDHIN